MKLQPSQRQVLASGAGRTPLMRGAGKEAGAVAEVTQQLHQGVDALGQQIREARVKSEVSNRLLTAQKEYNDYYTDRSTQAGGFKTLNEDVSKALTDIRSRAFDGLEDPAAQTALESRFAELETRKKMEANAEARRQEIKFSDDQVKSALTNARSVLANTADPREYSEAMKDALSAIDAQVSSGLYTKEYADQLRDGFMNDTTVDYYENMIREDPNRAVQELKGDQRVEELLPGEQNTLLGKANAELKRRQTSAELAIKDRVTDAVKAMTLGKEYPGYESLLAEAKGTKYEKDLVKNKASLDGALQFARMNPTAQLDTLKRYQNKTEMTGVEATQFERLQKIYKEQQKMLDEDPVGLAVAQGVIPERGHISFDPNDLEGTIDSLRGARANYETAKDRYGDQAGILMPSEIQALTTVMKQSDPGTQAAILSVMGVALDDTMPRAMEQLYDKGSTNYALAGQFGMEGDRDASILLLRGAKILEEGETGLPAKKEFTDAIKAEIGSAYAASSIHHKAVIDGITATYAAMSQDDADMSGVLDTDRLTAAVNHVTGGVIDYNGQMVPAPERGLNETQRGQVANAFEDWIDDMTEMEIERMGGIAGFSNTKALDLIQASSTRIVGAGAGKYNVLIEDHEGRYRPLRFENGEPFILDWEKKKQAESDFRVRWNIQ